MTTGSNGDVLRLEAPAEPSRPWKNSSSAEIIDALPYIDDDYGNPSVKAEVNRLLEEEMRRSSQKPSDFLKDLPPIPVFDFENYPMLAKEYMRVRAGKAPGTIDFTRYAHLDMPSGNKINDENAWRQSLLRAQRLLHHQEMRLENLELMAKYSSDVWIRHNQHLEVMLSRLQKSAKEINDKIEVVNRERKYHQDLCLKNIEIKAACGHIEDQIEEIKREASERGWNLEANLPNGALPE